MLSLSTHKNPRVRATSLSKLQQTQDRTAVIMFSSIITDKEEQTGLLNQESIQDHIVFPHSPENMSHTLFAGSNLDSLLSGTVLQAGHPPLMEPQQDIWKVLLQRGTFHLQVLWFGRCFQVATALHIFGSLVASQELVATPPVGGLSGG